MAKLMTTAQDRHRFPTSDIDEIIHLTGNDHSVISNALVIAAERYDDNARVCADTPRIAEQFHRQAEECRLLWDSIN